MLPKFIFITLNAYTLIYLFLFVLVDYSPDKIALLILLSYSFLKTNALPSRSMFFVNASFACVVAFLTSSPLLLVLGLLTSAWSFWCAVRGLNEIACQVEVVEHAITQRLASLFQPHLYFLVRLLVSMIGFSVFTTTISIVFMDGLLPIEFIVYQTVYSGLYLYGVYKLWHMPVKLYQAVLSLFFVFDMLFSVLPLRMTFATPLDGGIATCAYLVFAYLLVMRANQLFLKSDQIR